MSGSLLPFRLLGAFVAVCALVATYAVLETVAGDDEDSARPVAYAEESGCPDCPDGIELTSAEVQARDGSTLFVFRGRFPSSIADLPADVRLSANDVEVVLHPGGEEQVELTTATRDGEAMPDDAVAVGIVDGALVIDVKPALTAPVSFALVLSRGGESRGRLPRTGELVWDGEGAPHS